MASQSTAGAQKYLPAHMTARRLGVTPMTIYRWERDPASGFPAPVYFGRYKFHIISELEAWEASRPRGPRSVVTEAA